MNSLSGYQLLFQLPTSSPGVPPHDTRAYWVELLTRITEPVMTNLANGTPKQNMLLETAPGYNKKVEDVTYLEAFGRTAAGLAP
jgi:hypothetical protein